MHLATMHLNTTTSAHRTCRIANVNITNTLI